MSTASKSRVDKSGKVLSAPLDDLTEEYLELEETFDQYRQSHLEPLTSLTATIQNVLNGVGERY